MFLLPRPRRELASVLAPTQRRAPPAPPRGRRRDQPRASGERRSAATMRRKCRYTSRGEIREPEQGVPPTDASRGESETRDSRRTSSPVQEPRIR